LRSSRPEDYCDVFEELKRAGAPYVVVGGVAVVLHGHERPVSDLDIAVSSNPQHANITMQALLMRGFVSSVPLPLNMVTVLRLFDASGREVDVFVRFAVPFNELWSDSMEVAVGKTVARVASVAHLIRARGGHARADDLEHLETLRRMEERSS